MSLTFKQEDIDPVLPMKQPCMYFTLPAIDNSVNMFYNHLFAEQSIYAYEHMDNKSSFVPVNYFLSDFTSLGEISNFGRFFSHKQVVFLTLWPNSYGCILCVGFNGKPNSSANSGNHFLI